MKQTQQVALNTLMLERAALFHLLKFVERQYPILKNNLAADYLIIHYEILECLNKNTSGSYAHYLKIMFESIEHTLNQIKTLETTRNEFEKLKVNYISGKLTENDCLKFQTMHVLSPEEKIHASNEAVDINNDIAHACAQHYLPQKWGDDCTKLFTLQQELLCLQAWHQYFRTQSCFTHTEIKRHLLLNKKKSQFAEQFYQAPLLTKHTWIALNQFSTCQDTKLAWATLNAELSKIKKIIQREEQELKRHPCTQAQGLDYLYFKSIDYYYHYFPVTLMQQRSWTPTLFNLSVLALTYFTLAQSAPQNLSLWQYPKLVNKTSNTTTITNSLLRNLIKPG